MKSRHLFSLACIVCRQIFEEFSKFEEKFHYLQIFILFSSELYILCSLHIMGPPGQKRGTCRHIMALFDGHVKYPRCGDKGIGTDVTEKRLRYAITIFLSRRFS